MPGFTRDDIDRIFTYHPPASEEQKQTYVMIRGTAKELALVLLEHTPPSPEQTIAIRKLEEAVMYANAAVARHGGPIAGGSERAFGRSPWEPIEKGA